MEIAAMMRDQAFGSKSEMIVEGTSIDDLNISSIEDYRNRVRVENPECPYNNSVSVEHFCSEIGIVKNGSLTYASLLLFGKRSALMRYCSNFWIDYLEIPGTNLADGVRYSYRMPE